MPEQRHNVIEQRHVIPVRLEWHEMLVCALVGVLRMVSSVAKGRSFSDEYDPKRDDPWRAHIEGAAGEYAAARGLHRFWAPHVDTFGEPDIEPDIQVRTRSKSYYDLKVKKKDHPTRRVVLVTGVMPNYVVVGWMLAADAQRAEFWKDWDGRGHFNYFVPQKHLRDIDELVREVR